MCVRVIEGVFGVTLGSASPALTLVLGARASARIQIAIGIDTGMSEANSVRFVMRLWSFSRPPAKSSPYPLNLLPRGTLQREFMTVNTS